MKTPPWLHTLACVTAASTVILLCAGALVTSTGSGLAVPDWPLSYGKLFPAMVGGVLFEHGHRLIAGTVATLTIVQAFLIWSFETRTWVRNLGFAAVGIVLCQAALGGITVLLRLPTAVSVGHACLAQVFFCVSVTLALVTSPSWKRERSDLKSGDFSVFPFVALTLSCLFFCQLLMGAVVRHTGAGLAIPDFPAAFGGFAPTFWSPGIAIHFAHRMGALTVSIFAVSVAIFVYQRYINRLDLIACAGGLVGLISFQILLGAMIIWMKRPVFFTMSHVAVGALCFGTSILMTLKSFRLRYQARHPEKEFARAEVPTSSLMPSLEPA